MLHVGVTGGIGSGKSTVCRILEVFAVPVFNADLEAKRLVSEDPELRAELIGSFVSWVFVCGVLERKACAELVFH